MGCRTSKFVQVDDSIHVILSQAQGGKPTYVPRKPHPLLLASAVNAKPAMVTITETDTEMSSDDLDSLLFHATHHNDTIDPRDVEDYASQEEEQEQEASS